MNRECLTHLHMAGRAPAVNHARKSTAYRAGSCDSGMSAAYTGRLECIIDDSMEIESDRT